MLGSQLCCDTNKISPSPQLYIFLLENILLQSVLLKVALYNIVWIYFVHIYYILNVWYCLFILANHTFLSKFNRFYTVKWVLNTIYCIRTTHFVLVSKWEVVQSTSHLDTLNCGSEGCEVYTQISSGKLQQDIFSFLFFSWKYFIGLNSVFIGFTM